MCLGARSGMAAGRWRLNLRAMPVFRKRASARRCLEACARCGALFAAVSNTQVKDSRPTDEGSAIRRRRVCPDCGGRFTTFERVQLRELTVLKKSGRRVPFDRDKLMRSLEIALRKRPVEPDRLERMVTGIVRQLESQGESEVESEQDRRTRHGGVARARQRRLCAFCLGLSQFPRGAGFQYAGRGTGPERWRASGR